MLLAQSELFSQPEAHIQRLGSSSTFSDNLALPVHRWFRYSAGFSAHWVERVISTNPIIRDVRVFDPFAGSATTLLSAERLSVPSVGVEAHPFIFRVGLAKLAWRSDPQKYLKQVDDLQREANRIRPDISGYPELIRKCYDDDTLADLDVMRRALQQVADDSPVSQLLWLTLISILRKVSRAGTAQWQYVLPKKQKRVAVKVNSAFEATVRMIYHDMRLRQTQSELSSAQLLRGDARLCEGVPDGFATLVITSPPYPNNYDYADATRLEMSFMGEVGGWGDLHAMVRKYLVTSCSQHVPEKSVTLHSVLQSPDLDPIREELASICEQLAVVRESKGGRKTYHLMIASYFRDLAQVWKTLRRVCSTPSRVCFVIGDSAPYGVYVPVIPWLSKLAISSGFSSSVFVKTRDRNIKWKNRKHRVPLQEGQLWVNG